MKHLNIRLILTVFLFLLNTEVKSTVCVESTNIKVLWPKSILTEDSVLMISISGIEKESYQKLNFQLEPKYRQGKSRKRVVLNEINKKTTTNLGTKFFKPVSKLTIGETYRLIITGENKKSLEHSLEPLDQNNIKHFKFETYTWMVTEKKTNTIKAPSKDFEREFSELKRSAKITRDSIPSMPKFNKYFDKKIEEYEKKDQFKCYKTGYRGRLGVRTYIPIVKGQLIEARIVSDSGKERLIQRSNSKKSKTYMTISTGGCGEPIFERDKKYVLTFKYFDEYGNKSHSSKEYTVDCSSKLLHKRNSGIYDGF